MPFGHIPWYAVVEELLLGVGAIAVGAVLLPEALAAAAVAAVGEGLIAIEAGTMAAMTGATGTAIEMVGLGETVAAIGGAAGGAAATIDGLGLAGAGISMLVPETAQAVGAGLIGGGLGAIALGAGAAIHNGLAGQPGNQDPAQMQGYNGVPGNTYGPEPTQATPAQTTPPLPAPGTQGPSIPSAPAKRPAEGPPENEPGSKRPSYINTTAALEHHMYMVAPGIYYDDDFDMYYDEDDDMYYDLGGNRAKRRGDTNFFDAKPPKKTKQSGASFCPATTDTVSVSLLALLAAVTALISAVTAKLAHSHCHVEIDDGASDVVHDSSP